MFAMLDAATLKMITALVAAVSLVVLVALMPRDASGSRGWWIAGLGLLVLQWLICNGMAGLADLPRAVCAQMCGAFSLLAMTALAGGLWRLAQRPLPRLWFALVLALALSFGLADQPVSEHGELVFDLANGVILLTGALALWRPLAEVPDRLRLLLGGAVLGAALAMGLRAEHLITGAATGLPPGDPGPELASLLLNQVALALGNLSYVLVLRARGLARLRREAELDPLTGVLNRAALHARLGHERAGNTRERAGMVVMVFDVLELGAINRSAGHMVGDRILLTVAQTLRAALPRGVTVGRYAADQFLVALRADGAPLRALAERLCEALAEAVRETPIRVAAGVAESRADAPDLLRLASLAEIDLRAAKQAMRSAEWRP